MGPGQKLESRLGLGCSWVLSVLQGVGCGPHWPYLGSLGWPRWYKDGVLLTTGSKYQMLSDSRSGVLVLTIRAASKEDLGRYECEVRRVRQRGRACLRALILIAGQSLGPRELDSVREQQATVPTHPLSP